MDSTLGAQNTIVLYFDLDQTLLESEMETKGVSRLTEGAKVDLSTSLDGIADSYCYKENGDIKSSGKITAFARNEFKAIFNKINDCNSAGLNKKVIVRALTNNYYGESDIKKILSCFYGCKVEFDGYANAYRKVPDPTNPEINLYHPGKGATMDSDYNQVYGEMGISKNNIYLIDDSEKNCMDAEAYGFKTVRMGTHSKESNGYNYVEEKSKIFSELSKLLDDTLSRGL